MSAAATELLTAFESLPEPERESVLEAMLLRMKPGVPRFSDDALSELADELFQAYDAAEATDAAPAH